MPSRLQRVQNCAAGLIFQLKIPDHINLSLMTLHWLPIHFRIKFKVLPYVFKSLHGLASQYLKVLVNKYILRRTLRLLTRLLLETATFKISTCGPKMFKFTAPVHWNALPLDVRSVAGVADFKDD